MECMILHKQAYSTDHDAKDRCEDGATIVVDSTKQGSIE